MKIKLLKKIEKPSRPVLIEGLPGIGNVGKIAVDYLVTQLKATKIAEITSEKFPNLVIISNKNIVVLPAIHIYHKKYLKQDFFFVVGDFQPGSEDGSYELSNAIVKFVSIHGIKEVVTMGGIGLDLAPDEPNVFVTGNTTKVLESYKKIGANPQVHGIVGTIIGVTGLVIGLVPKTVNAASLLVETSAEAGPQALIAGKKLIEVLVKKFKLKVSYKQLDEEITRVAESGIDESVTGKTIHKVQETNYIG